MGAHVGGRGRSLEAYKARSRRQKGINDLRNGALGEAKGRE